MYPTVYGMSISVYSSCHVYLCLISEVQSFLRVFELLPLVVVGRISVTLFFVFIWIFDAIVQGKWVKNGSKREENVEGRFEQI